MGSYWRVLQDFGAGKLVASVQHDKTGKELRQLIEKETIDLDEIVETARRLIQRVEATAAQRFLGDLERALNEGELEYIIPQEKRDPGDPFIQRLSKFVDPTAVLNSRYVTSFEKILREKSLHLVKEILHTVDEIETMAAQIKAQDTGGWMELRITKFQDLMNHLFEITDSIQIVAYQDESATETAYLCLLLRHYAFCELRDRLALFYSKLLEDAPDKFLVAFLNHKIIRYTQEINEYTRQENVHALQKGIRDLRKASQMVGARFSMEQESMPFVETLHQLITPFVEALHPDYPLLFPQGVPKVLKNFIGFDKSLKKYAKKIQKILTKEETPENAWRKLQAQLEALTKEIQSL